MNKKRVVLITGSAKGLGYQTAISLAKLGHDIIINYRNSEKEALKLSNYINQNYNVKTLVVKADVGKRIEVSNMFKLIYDKFKGVDILIHNAGPFISDNKLIDDYTTDEWQHIIDGNLNSYFYLLKEVLPFMKKQKWGRIIAMGFNKGNESPAWKYRGAFAASKSAVISLTKTLALEEGSNNITANVILPGDIKDSYKEMTIEESRSLNKTKRKGTGEDISRIISFLIDEDSDYINGAVIEVNGGNDILSKKNNC